MNYECGEANPNWSAERAERAVPTGIEAVSVVTPKHFCIDTGEHSSYRPNCGCGECLAYWRTRNRNAAISAHAAHGCGLPSLSTTDHYYRLYVAERALRQQLELENERLREVLDKKSING